MIIPEKFLDENPDAIKIFSIKGEADEWDPESPLLGFKVLSIDENGIDV